MGFKNGAVCTVFDVEPVSEKVTKVRIAVSSKKPGTNPAEYIQDFGGYVRVLGAEPAKRAAKLRKFDRIKIWSMPNSKTFQIKPIKEFVERNLTGTDGGVIVDPFANDSKYGTITNDLNPAFDTTYHMDALDFLKTIPDESVDVVLYDPPYSLRQVSECYKGFGIEVTQETTQSSWRARHLDEIKRILKPGGKALCFGWNSNGVGKTRGFDMVEILLVPHGGSKNDTICTAEIKQ